MNMPTLYEIDKVLYEKIKRLKTEREIEVKAYIQGMEDGADMFRKAVRDYLNGSDAQ